jgi:DNA-binding MarR family transcriptional regulator
MPRTSKVGKATGTTTPNLAYLIGRLDRILRHAIDTAVRGHGLTVAQYTTLSVLGAGTPLSNAQLARRSLVTPQAMNEVLLALEARALVRRNARPDNGRILQTRLTAKGRTVLAECDAEVAVLEAKMLGATPASERAQLRKLVIRCSRALLDVSSD